MRFSWAGNPADDVSARLFVIHTFDSLLIKLLAAEILAAHGLTSGRGFAEELATIEDDVALMKRLRFDIEEGGFFETTGIHGFVEEAIFSWYLALAELLRTEHRSLAPFEKWSRNCRYTARTNWTILGTFCAIFTRTSFPRLCARAWESSIHPIGSGTCCRQGLCLGLADYSRARSDLWFRFVSRRNCASETRGRCRRQHVPRVHGRHAHTIRVGF